MPIRLKQPTNPACPRPHHAMILCAGLGMRMRPLTLATPKPLIQVAGETLLDRHLDRLAEWGVDDAVVNIHHLGEQIAEHVKKRAKPRVAVSDETDALLDTGGGVAHALPLLGADPFFVLNSDVIWGDGPHATFARLWEALDPAEADIVLLLQATAKAHGYDGPGDYALDADGRPVRRGEARIAPYVFAGVSLIHPRVFVDLPEGAFSLNLLFDRAAEAGRLRGLQHDGAWYHVGTPEAIPATERLIRLPQYP